MVDKDFYLITGGGHLKVLAVEDKGLKMPFIALVSFAAGCMALSIHWLSLINIPAFSATMVLAAISILAGLKSSLNLLMPSRFSWAGNYKSGFWGLLMGASAMIIALFLCFVGFILLGGA
ncbi:MAG: hypothetical protein KAR56_00560 [Thermoplasmata archaeon]|nr:hypothetical protein [Thermoplasmata archaeon]